MNWIVRDGKRVIPGIVMMLIMGSVYSYSVFRLAIEDSFQISTSLSGLPYMFSLFFYAIFMGVSGKILERVHQYKVMLMGVFFIAFGWLISYFATNLVLLTLGYGVLIGTGIGLIYGIPLMVITHQFPERKGIYLGLVLLGFGLSPFITAPIMQRLVEVRGLFPTFLYMSIFTLVSLFGLSLFYKNDDFKYSHHKNNRFVDTLKTKDFQLLYVLFFIATFIGLSVIGYSSSYGSIVLNLSLPEAALFVSIFAIFNGLGRVIFGYLTDRFKISIIMIISFISLMMASFINIIWESIFIFALSFSVFWLNLGGWLAIAPVTTSTLFGTESYTKNYGFLFSAYGLSALIGVFITGILVEAFDGYQSTFILYFVLSNVALVLTLVFKRINRKNI